MCSRKGSLGLKSESMNLNCRKSWRLCVLLPVWRLCTGLPRQTHAYLFNVAKYCEASKISCSSYRRNNIKNVLLRRYCKKVATLRLCVVKETSLSTFSPYQIDWLFWDLKVRGLSAFQTWLALIFQAQTILFFTLAVLCLFNHILFRVNSCIWVQFWVVLGSHHLYYLQQTLWHFSSHGDQTMSEADSDTHKWQLLASDVQTLHLA